MAAHAFQDREDADREVRAIDRAYLVETLSRLAQVPTNVPLGFDTLMEPDDPKLVHYAQHVMRPDLVRLGCAEADDRAQVVRSGNTSSLSRFSCPNWSQLVNRSVTSSKP